jgi:tRNA pseudouridine38-40 synthase
MIALWCWYRGERFHGYQRQQALRTVQDELLKAFALAGLSRNPVVAGRTDRGVSARMQVLSGRLEREIAPEEVAARLNALLPADLGIHRVREVEPGFHAAWSSNAKEYRYQLGGGEVGDARLLEQTAAMIPGTRNFKVFHFKSSEEKPRTVSSVEVLFTPTGATLRFVGQGFARHMVRMLVGGMTAVSGGRVGLEIFREGLLSQRNFYCPTAAPEPLTLWDVGYPPEVDPFTADERASFAFR